jgi:1-acyl-sn-glycerol-3-phosphate acyltransferase
MRTALVVLFFVLVVVVGLPFILFCMIAGQREPLMGYGLGAAWVARRILGIEVRASGLERFDPRVPHVLMPNHQSFLDGPLVMLLVPGRARVILKQSVLRVPIVGQAMRFVGFVPVDRKGAEGGKKSIARAAALMREKGYSFLIFPEGTRSLDGNLGPFRRGGFFLALESGAPIVPVTIRGTRELMPKGQWFARRGRAEVVFREAIPTAGVTVESMPGLMEKVKRAILAAENSPERGEPGEGQQKAGL